MNRTNKIDMVTLKANLIKLKNVFSSRVDQILQIETYVSFTINLIYNRKNISNFYFRLQKGISVEFILTPLLSAIGFYLSTSTIEAFPNSPESLCVYTALIAHASTGKSQALRKVKFAFSKVEKYFEVNDNDSQLSNTATIESLLDLLNRLKSIIGFIILINYFLISLLFLII